MVDRVESSGELVMVLQRAAAVTKHYKAVKAKRFMSNISVRNVYSYGLLCGTTD